MQARSVERARCVLCCAVLLRSDRRIAMHKTQGDTVRRKTATLGIFATAARGAKREREREREGGGEGEKEEVCACRESYERKGGREGKVDGLSMPVVGRWDWTVILGKLGAGGLFFFFFESLVGWQYVLFRRKWVTSYRKCRTQESLVSVVACAFC
ncbi:hypothetical protein LZ31DRAFT_204672 [Colletotrichum somersetense]|nr:hypothetical protein LZ31DRAFT_204672 [Colletotrichum somersetense]